MAGVRVVGLPGALPRRRTEPEGRRRHLRVVGPGRTGLGLALSPRAGVILTVLAFVALFGVAASHALLIQNQANVDELDSRVAAEQARYEELRLEVAQLESPQRISTEAQQTLGMVPAGEVEWLTPDEPAPPDESEDLPESPGTSAERVKPYLDGASP
jgi:cell division protein FtsL